mmetsp:Transcript_17100/g.20717  ORF Transcript_17100/g.20717 Transcript_17100/m.20717 type:complete len:150 (+) Transcript_17100:574-1023(+)
MKYLKRHRINQLQSRLEGENLFPAGLRKAKRTKTFFRILVSTIRELDRYSTVLARCTSSKVQTVLKSDQCLLPVLVLGFPKNCTLQRDSSFRSHFSQHKSWRSYLNNTSCMSGYKSMAAVSEEKEGFNVNKEESNKMLCNLLPFSINLC